MKTDCFAPLAMTDPVGARRAVPAMTNGGHGGGGSGGAGKPQPPPKMPGGRR